MNDDNESELEDAAVEAIVLHRYNAGQDRVEYLIQWQDATDGAAFSWEPEENAVDADELVYRYWREKRGADHAAAREYVEATKRNQALHGVDHTPTKAETVDPSSRVAAADTPSNVTGSELEPVARPTLTATTNTSLSVAPNSVRESQTVNAEGESTLSATDSQPPAYGTTQVAHFQNSVSKMCTGSEPHVVDHPLSRKRIQIHRSTQSNLDRESPTSSRRSSPHPTAPESSLNSGTTPLLTAPMSSEPVSSQFLRNKGDSHAVDSSIIQSIPENASIEREFQVQFGVATTEPVSAAKPRAASEPPPGNLLVTRKLPAYGNPVTNANSFCSPVTLTPSLSNLVPKTASDDPAKHATAILESKRPRLDSDDPSLAKKHSNTYAKDWASSSSSMSFTPAPKGEKKKFIDQTQEPEKEESGDWDAVRVRVLTLRRQDAELHALLQFPHGTYLHPVSVAKKRCPQALLAFYESRVRFTPPAENADAAHSMPRDCPTT